VSDAKHFESKGSSGEAQGGVMRSHRWQRTHAIAPDQRSRQVQRIESAERHGQRFSGPVQHWWPQQHQGDGRDRLERADPSAYS
jgi:hypothetical protein